MKDPTVHWCSNCDKRMARAHGLCNHCYSYQYRYKRPRPARLWDTERVIEVCHCGDFAVVSGECEACRRYRNRRHKRRPNRLANRTRLLCQRCARPILKYRQRRGLCNACYFHLYRYGRQRPMELILKQAPLGWCDACGQPAHRVETITAAGKPFTLRICPACDTP